MRLPVLTAVLLAALAFAGRAHAATVSFDLVEDYDASTPVVAYDAAPGEANDLAVTLGRTGRTARVHDAGATITAGDHCTSVGAHTATCTLDTPGGPPGFDAILGDGDDTLRVASIAAAGKWSVSADGGAGRDDLGVLGHPVGTQLRGDAGNDRISGSAGPDQVDGGPGHDVIDGHAGADGLTGGDGADVIRGGAGNDDVAGGPNNEPTAPAVDHMDGGPGRDTVDYFERTKPVHVDLAKQTAEEGGHRDVIRSMENADGGFAADVLIGSAGPNTLDGEQGRDVLRGLGGNDRLTAHGEHARVAGGAGNDVIRLENQFPGTSSAIAVACGTGRDTVILPIQIHTVPPTLPGTCNRTSPFFSRQIHDGFLVSFTRPRVTRGTATLYVDSGARTLDPGGLLTLRTPAGKLLGRGTYRAGAGERAARIRLNAAGRRAAARHDRVLLRNQIPPGYPGVAFDQGFAYALRLGR